MQCDIGVKYEDDLLPLKDIPVNFNESEKI